MAGADEGSRDIPDLGSRTVAVTGATGFLGGHVMRALRGTGARVVGIVDRARSTSRNPEVAAMEKVYFDEPREIASIVRELAPEYVIHLHAVITTARDAGALERTVAGNLIPSLDLMFACMELGIERLILLGSGEEFAPVTGRFDDTSNANPPSPYGASKAATTCYAKMFWNAFRLPVIVLRPSVIYGPYQAPRMLVPQVMHALRKREPIAVTAGIQTRDFIHVEDVARGIVRALTVADIVGRSWNLGTGEVVRVKDCLERIEAISGVRGLIQYGALPYKTGEIFTYEPVVKETFAALNWRPRISLDEGLASTWAALTAVCR